MKKTVIFSLLVILLAFSLIGCGDPLENEDCTVTFDLNSGNIGGNNASVSRTVKSGETIALALFPNPVRQDYTLNGWITGSGSTFDENIKVTSNLTVYAKWTSNAGDNETIAGVWLCTIDSDTGIRITIVKDGDGYTFIQENKGMVASGFEDWTNWSKGTITLTGTNIMTMTTTITHYWTFWEANPGWSSDSLDTWNQDYNNNSGLTYTGNITGTPAGSKLGEAPYIFIKQ
jgi:uncharacterized repeat protein (TIGR02543 family)